MVYIRNETNTIAVLKYNNVLKLIYNSSLINVFINGVSLESFSVVANFEDWLYYAQLASSNNEFTCLDFSGILLET